MRRTTLDSTGFGTAPPRWVLVVSVLVTWAPVTSTASVGEAPAKRRIFDFDRSEEQRGWRAVNDGVMGGLSRGGPRVRTDEGLLEFSGVLSLENNGGFSSVRTTGPQMDLGDFDGITLRLRGDGREYAFTISTDYRVPAGSYRSVLPAVRGEWLTVRLPFDDFGVSSYGRPVPDAPPLNRRAIRSIGFILADKRSGPFKLEVDWIEAYRNGRSESDIVDTAAGAGSFKTLVAGLRAAGLLDTFGREGPFTVFAPTDEAFAKLPAGTVDTLLEPANRDVLISVLQYHVIPGRVTSDQVAKRSRARTLSGQVLQIELVEGKVRIEDATVTRVDIAASNGVIHAIDSVLMPPGVSAATPDSPVARARDLIELAIRRGVPMYNHGDEAACAAIYEVAAHGLVALSPHLPGNERWGRMRATLETLRGEHDMDRRAWALRRMLDDTYRFLNDL